MEYENGDLWDFRSHSYWLKREVGRGAAEFWEVLEQKSANLFEKARSFARITVEVDEKTGHPDLSDDTVYLKKLEEMLKKNPFPGQTA
ncbi:MAG: hypothetical protein CSA23_00510 [Deltaproteobacteria bacterium]|nr:MAG: hypothetical protein CSA23_00510 [Deltaproteobacteria bacterium]